LASRAIQKDPQLVVRAELLYRAQLGQGVAGSELGGLRDGDHAGLSEVLIAPPGQTAGDELGGDLAAGRRDGEQLGTEYPLGAAALVGVDVRGLGADDRLVAAEQEAEPEHVRAASVEHQVHLTLRRGEPLEVTDGALGPWVGPVGHRVPAVGLDDGAHHIRMRAGVVVAAKALPCCQPGHRGSSKELTKDHWSQHSLP